jgi:hypothetical protein
MYIYIKDWNNSNVKKSYLCMKWVSDQATIKYNPSEPLLGTLVQHV